MLGHNVITPFDFEPAASDSFQDYSYGINCLVYSVIIRYSSALRSIAALGSFPREMHRSYT